MEKEVEQRKLAEKELLRKNRQLNEAQDIAKLGHWEWDIISGTLYWSKGMYRVFDLDDTQPISYDLFLNCVHPDDREQVNRLVTTALETRVFPEYYHRVIVKSGEVRTIHARGEIVVDSKGDVIKLLGTGQDVTEIKKAEQALLIKTRELQQVNSELEKFAYVASHDLQEPLRKLTTYASLLNNDYKHLLDENGLLFLDKITHSSLRMKKLINDVLNFSKLSSQQMEVEPTDLHEIVQNIVSDLEIVIADSGAQVTVENLPEIEANALQMHQLFINLISNALKFRKENEAPRIHIGCTMVPGLQLPAEYIQKYQYRFNTIGSENLMGQEKFCQVTITDNGIGFNQQYIARIFEVFQRLHNKKQYEGTGIGLAICKKIIENHDGYITAESHEGQGSVFTIYLPVSQKHFKKVVETQMDSVA